MNKIHELYGSSEQWDLMAGRSLSGSNLLARNPIEKIDYTVPENRQGDKGYYGALVRAVSAGLEKQPLTAEIVEGWRQSILEEMMRHGVIAPDEINAPLKRKEIKSLLESIEKEISSIQENGNEINVISILSKVLFEIESKNLFHPIKRRINHLIMNYIVSYFNMPLIVFTSKDKENYLDSIDSELKLKIHLSEKIREAIFFRGLLLNRVGGSYATEWYKAPGSLAKKDLSIEWHDLFSAVKSWKEQLSLTK